MNPVLFFSINGEPADDLRALLTDFKMKQDVKKSTETTMVFRNDDRRLLDDSRFLPNTRWHIRFGFFDDLSPIHVALVRNVEPEYDLKRIVTITFYDLAMNLSTVSSGRNWGKIRSSEIAVQIAKIHGMECVADKALDIPTKAYIQPNKTNDLQYLRDLAAQIDFEVVVEGNPPVLYYRKKIYDGEHEGTFVYFDDPTHRSALLSFKPKVKSFGALATASSGANTKGGKDGKSATDKGGSLGAKQSSGAEGDTDDYSFVLTADENGDEVTESAVKNQKGASTLPTPTGASGNVAQVARQQMLDRANEADAKFAFTSSVKSGATYNFLGMEKQVNGKWYAAEANFTISSSGNGTTLSLKRNAKGKGGKDTKNPNDKDKKSDDDDNGYVRIEAESEEVDYVPPGAAKKKG